MFYYILEVVKLQCERVFIQILKINSFYMVIDSQAPPGGIFSYQRITYKGY